MDALRNMFRSLWQRYHSAKRRNQIIIGVVTVFAVMIACSGLVSAMQGGTSPAAEEPQATQQPTAAATATEAPALPTWTPEPSTPTPKPTATPVPTATPRPVPTATPRPPAPTSLSLAVTDAEIVHGGTGSVTVHANAGAALAIKVYYVATGRIATSDSLEGTHYADSNGNYTWVWSCQTSKAGTAEVTVRATWNGQSKQIVQTFPVQ